MKAPLFEICRRIPDNLLEITSGFRGEFGNAGFCRDFECFSENLVSGYSGEYGTLGDVLEGGADIKLYLDDQGLEVLKHLKGGKSEDRISKDGYAYRYSEGPLPFPDPSDKPARTMLTSEGSKARTSHAVEDPETHRMRMLSPLECERLNGFPDGWTEGMPERMRYFCMGNALVTGLVERMGAVLSELVSDI